MTCAHCGAELELDSTDSRQEWTDEYYWCPVCGTEHQRRTTYENGLVIRDELFPLTNLS